MACPENSSGHESCACDEGYSGEVVWDKDNKQWDGACVSGLEMAIKQGTQNMYLLPMKLLRLRTRRDNAFSYGHTLVPSR